MINGFISKDTEARLDWEVGKLYELFGDSWHGKAAELREFGETHLPQRLYEKLAASYDGVILLHNLYSFYIKGETK